MEEQRTKRSELARLYAEELSRHQDHHLRLMEALRDKNVSLRAFRILCIQLHKQLVELKRLQMELDLRRDDLDRTDG